VRELQGQRLFAAEAARAAGLVDALVPYDGAERALQQELGSEDVELVDAAPKKARKQKDLFSMLAEMFRPKRDDADDSDADEIVVLHLAGAIEDGVAGSPGNIVSGPAVEAIDAVAKNAHVKGVVVRVNSPGGSATASEAVRRALLRLAAKKPLVYSMGELAASGGYWITCIGKPIVAEPTTITGSIGVFSMRFQAGALMRRLGVHTDVVGLDESVEMDAIDRPWTDSARARMQTFVDDVYERFVRIASESRKLPPDALRAIAGGRVWSGAQALQLGLVDKVGGLDDALAMVRQQAGVKDDVEVRHLPQPKDFASVIMERMFESQARLPFGIGADGTRLDQVLGLFTRTDGLLALLRNALHGDDQGTVWALLPLDLAVR
jgi:protease-4